MLACAVATPAVAAEAPASLVLHARALIDGTGHDPLAPAFVLVQGDRIAAVGTTLASVHAPVGARTIDLGSRTLLPGFIDCHVHLVGRYIGEGRDWQNAAVRDLPAEEAIRGVRNARLTLEAGFTTVRMVGARGFSDVALRNAIREGLVDGPRILTAGHAIGITGGHCDTNGYIPGVAERGPEAGIANGVGEVLGAVREQIKHGADVIKFCATGGVLSEGDAVGVQQFTEEEMRAIVTAAHFAERRVAAHAHGTEGIKAALRAGVDSIEHGSLLDDEAIELFLRTGAFLVPTLMAQESVERSAAEGTLVGQRAEKAKFIAPHARASFRKAVAAGVKIALGSDAGVFAHGTQGRELVLMAENGMTPMQAILAGTRNAAELLGLAAQVGTVEAGKVADLVAVDGDPLAKIDVVVHPAFVLHEGRIVVGP